MSVAGVLIGSRVGMYVQIRTVHRRHNDTIKTTIYVMIGQSVEIHAVGLDWLCRKLLGTLAIKSIQFLNLKKVFICCTERQTSTRP